MGIHKNTADELQKQINEMKIQLENLPNSDTNNAPAGSEGFREKIRTKLRVPKLSTDRQEQWTRGDATRIRTLQEKPNEDTYGIVREVLGDIGVQVMVNDISTCHRTGRKRRNSGRERDIIVYFTQRDTKYTVMRNKHKYG